MTDTRTWRDAHENTAEILFRAEGVTYGLMELIDHFQSTHPGNPSINAMAMIAETLHDTIKSGARSHDHEFSVGIERATENDAPMQNRAEASH